VVEIESENDFVADAVVGFVVTDDDAGDDVVVGSIQYFVAALVAFVY
jgi:hypothetical protein